MRKIKKLYSIVLVILIVCSGCGKENQEVETTTTEEELATEAGTSDDNIPANGTTGDCSWSFDGSTLTISGNGEMEDYSSTGQPWDTKKSYITKVIIEDGVTKIGKMAFEECQCTSVSIPDSVKEIGQEAFYFCEKVTSLAIPDSVTTINSGAFWGCSSLTSITLSNSIDVIDENLFWYCPSLTSVEIPEGVSAIKDCAFGMCENLESITVPKSLSYFGKNVFEDCTNIKDIYYAGTEEEWNSIFEHGFPYKEITVHCASSEALAEETAEATEEETPEPEAEEPATEAATEAEKTPGVFQISDDITLRVPDLPATYQSYFYNSDTRVKWDIKITKIEAKPFDSQSGNNVTITVTALMEKCYDEKQHYGGVAFKLIGPPDEYGYDLYYSGYVLGTIRCDEGDIISEDINLEMREPGEYTLVLEDSHIY